MATFSTHTKNSKRYSSRIKAVKWELTKKKVPKTICAQLLQCNNTLSRGWIKSCSVTHFSNLVSVLTQIINREITFNFLKAVLVSLNWMVLQGQLQVVHEPALIATMALTQLEEPMWWEQTISMATFRHSKKIPYSRCLVQVAIRSQGYPVPQPLPMAKSPLDMEHKMSKTLDPVLSGARPSKNKSIRKLAICSKAIVQLIEKLMLKGLNQAIKVRSSRLRQSRWNRIWSTREDNSTSRMTDLLIDWKMDCKGC